MEAESAEFSFDYDQEQGNYNVICQSCGKILGVNIENQEDAFNVEEKHSEATGCKYTGSHLIREKF